MPDNRGFQNHGAPRYQGETRNSAPVFDIKTLDKALQSINGGRSDLGAQSNSYDYAININDTAKYNTYAAKSSMMDTEYGEYVSQMKKQGLLEQVQAEMQRKRQEDADDPSHLCYHLSVRCCFA